MNLAISVDTTRLTFREVLLGVVQPVRWICASNPPFRSIGVALGMAVCYRETVLRVRPIFYLTAKNLKIAND